MRNDEPILIVNGANVQCTSGTFTLRDNSSTGSVSTNGGTFSLSCEVRSGAVEALNNINDYTATIPAGQVGVWAGSGTATVKADDFKATSLATFGDVDGRWFSSDGGASLVSGKLELSNADDVEQQTVRRGFRGGKYIMEYDHPVVSLNKNGVVLHWQDPENFMIVLFDKGVSNVTPRLAKREGGDYTAISSGSAFSMSNGDRVRIVIQDDPGNSALQELQVDVNGTVRLTSTAIDDDWSAGSVGFYVKSGSGGTLGYDNLKIGYDNNADDDIADAGDDIQIDDDFASSAMTLTYDDNGNLTDDGIFKFVYDAWNRLVKVQRRPEPTETKSLVATYAYDGANRRASKVVTNTGVETYPNDGGETTVHFYYGGVEPEPTPFGGLMPKCWNIFETRNGSNQSTWQYFWGTQYVDEIILTDKNGDPTVGNDTDPDGTAGEGGESPADHRYFYHQDRNWNVVALTLYGPGDAGAVSERYGTPLLGTSLICIASSDTVPGTLALVSHAGNTFIPYGIYFDAATSSLEIRRRALSYDLGRFYQRDLLGYTESLNLTQFAQWQPTNRTDPSGLATSQQGGGACIPTICFGLNVTGGVTCSAKVLKKTGVCPPTDRIEAGACNDIKKLVKTSQGSNSWIYQDCSSGCVCSNPQDINSTITVTDTQNSTFCWGLLGKEDCNGNPLQAQCSVTLTITITATVDGWMGECKPRGTAH